MTQNYSLEIISHHPTFNNKSLRKYYVDGIDTIGAWGDEPFEIKFTNHTWQKIQVKLSLDGTDILSGNKATTEVDSNMWVVNGGGTMTLKAWPETNNGGAQFVFTSANNSVAVHTHGDLSARGIIAAAVFIEGQPIAVLNQPQPIVIHDHHYHYPRYYDYWTYPYGTIYGGIANQSYNITTPVSMSFNNSNTYSGSAGASVNLCSAGQNSTQDFVETSELESLAAVGAGQHVDQQITYVSGLIKPTLSETVRVRYMWWDELVAKLRQHNVAAPHASGFPGDKKQGNINLGKTPRVGNYQKAAFPRQAEPVYTRV
jgi:hypothetical protein